MKLFDGSAKTVVFNARKHEENKQSSYYQVTEDVDLVHQISNALYQMNVQSVIVEGGARLLQSFIDEGSWDEARVIVNKHRAIGKGLPAPILVNAEKVATENIFTDQINFFKRVEP